MRGRGPIANLGGSGRRRRGDCRRRCCSGRHSRRSGDRAGPPVRCVAILCHSGNSGAHSGRTQKIGRDSRRQNRLTSKCVHSVCTGSFLPLGRICHVTPLTDQAAVTGDVGHEVVCTCGCPSIANWGVLNGTYAKEWPAIRHRRNLDQLKARLSSAPRGLQRSRFA